MFLAALAAADKRGLLGMRGDGGKIFGSSSLLLGLPFRSKPLLLLLFWYHVGIQICKAVRSEVHALFPTCDSLPIEIGRVSMDPNRALGIETGTGERGPASWGDGEGLPG